MNVIRTERGTERGTSVNVSIQGQAQLCTNVVKEAQKMKVKIEAFLKLPFHEHLILLLILKRYAVQIHRVLM